jgi:RNA polymerase sigma factor (sigma-70 family)
MTDQEFREYVAVHYDRFLRVVHGRVRNAAAAEDVLQGALVKLWLHHESIEATRPKAYFLRALKNAATDYLRKIRRQEWSTDTEDEWPDPRPPDPEPEPEPDIDAVEDAFVTCLTELRDQMTAQQRLVLSAFVAAKGSQSVAKTLIPLTSPFSYPNALHLPRPEGWFPRPEGWFPRQLLTSPSSYPNALHRVRERLREQMGSQLEMLLRILGGARLWELLAGVFNDCQAQNEDQSCPARKPRTWTN